MLTALISLISGIVTGAVPEILKEIRESREAKREREWLELNHRLQMEREKAGAEDKMRLAEANLAAEEIRAMREHLTAIVEAHAQPTGIKWIDGFNALLRPAASTGVIGHAPFSVRPADLPQCGLPRAGDRPYQPLVSCANHLSSNHRSSTQSRARQISGERISATS